MCGDTRKNFNGEKSERIAINHTVIKEEVMFPKEPGGEDYYMWLGNIAEKW